MKRALFLLFPIFLFSAPAQVILIRHAEKPATGNGLSLKGRERAHAFVPFFQGAPSVLSYGLPEAIFAAAPSTNDPSVRSLQTILPLCNEMNLTVKDQFTIHQTQEITNELLNNPDYEGKMVLVCWPHAELPAIAKLLGAKKTPEKWSDDVYDRLWILTFNEKGEVSFQNLPQKLLYGDSSK